MNIKACIFDLDGVIVDTAGYHYESWAIIAEQLGFTFTIEQNEPLKGLSRMDSLEELLKIGKIELDIAEKEEICHQKNEIYLSKIDKIGSNEILPGVTDFLNELVDRGMPFALGSASKNARRIIEKVGLSETFTAIVDGTDVKNSKPDPEVFLLGAKLLKVYPANTIVFEDSYKGLEAAERGGFIKVGIGNSADLPNSDLVYPNFTQFDVKQLFKALQKMKSNQINF